MGSSFKLEWGPAICMVLIELFTTGQMLLTKVVVDAGLFVFALLTYRFFLGAALVVPLALILEPYVIASLLTANASHLQDFIVTPSDLY